MKAEPIGLYIHIPFCLKKCNYCDFCSFSDLSADVRKSYISALVKEIKKYRRAEKIKVDTVFFGGGTPSLLTPSEFYEIYGAVTDTFAVSDNVEFTVEANPKTLSCDKLLEYTLCGVNRISIGLQSIHENELKILGRIHNYKDFCDAYKLASRAGIDNIAVDVMYGIPEQTVSSFKQTLEAVAELSPAHISAYGLIIEEGTKFWDMRGTLDFPSEDAECDMYGAACALLSSYGYSHYEISNYSRPGFESSHNMKYWRCGEYVGVGVAAYSYYGGRRYGNSRKLSEYLSDNAEQYITSDTVGKESAAYEYVMLGLRLKRGISLSEYRQKFGNDFCTGRESVIARLINGDYMCRNSDMLALTEKGFYVSNAILTELL